MTQEDAVKRIYEFIISGEIGSYECTYARSRAVITISNMVDQIEDLTKYRARKALKELIDRGVIEYTSQGNPAVESYGEYRELVYDAAPPTNGYALTKDGFNSPEYHTAYKEWCDGLKRWAEGY